jgi:hypothetical protein
MNITYKEMLRSIMASPTSHRWLVQNADQLAQRDCVDAYYDALTFAKLAKIRMDEALGRGSK